MAEPSRLSEIIRTSLENIRSVADVNTVVGSEIVTKNGTVIVPVSKIAVGLASGGVDYFGKAVRESVPKTNDSNFGGGGGTGVSVTPVAFLIIKPDGDVELLNVAMPTGPAPVPTTVESVVGAIEKAPDLIRRLKDAFKKEDGEAKSDA